jgi:MFS family permease
MSSQKKTPKNIRVFASATFLNDLGSDMIASIWPLFVTNVLKANMSALGLLDGIGNSLVSISKAASGYLSDKTKKRKIFIWSGYLMGAAGRFGFALSRTWAYLIPFKILERLGKVRSAPRDALVSESSHKGKLGRNFGFLRSMDHLGGIAGILLSILLIRFLGFRTIIMLGALPTLISALLILTLIQKPEKKLSSQPDPNPSKKIHLPFKFFLIISSLYSLGAFSYSFLLLFAKNHGFSFKNIPLLYLIITASASVSSLFAGRLSDQIGRKPILGAAYIFWMAVCVGFPLNQSPLFIFTGLVLYGVHIGIINPTWRAMAAEMSPEEHRAGYIGIFQMVTGLCALPASFFAGLLWDQVGMKAPFYLSLGLTFLSGTLLLFWKNPGRTLTYNK